MNDASRLRCDFPVLLLLRSSRVGRTSLLPAQVVQAHQAVGFTIGLFYPVNDARRVGRVFQLDRNNAIDLAAL